MKRLFLYCLLLIPASLTAKTMDVSRVLGHTLLQQAVRYNNPPSGYIDLSYCDSVKSIGDMPLDRKTYRLSFADNFIFNPDNGELTTIVKTSVLQTQMVGSAAVLSSLPATAIVSSVPKSPYLRYQITLTQGERTSMRTYMCDWEKAVYLWK